MRASVVREGLVGVLDTKLLTTELLDQVAIFVPLSFSESSTPRAGAVWISWYVDIWIFGALTVY